ncbi:MAG: hypothetical protein AAF734_06440, partial [Bacteroidota bacterium]
MSEYEQRKRYAERNRYQDDFNEAEQRDSDALNYRLEGFGEEDTLDYSIEGFGENDTLNYSLPEGFLEDIEEDFMKEGVGHKGMFTNAFEPKPDPDPDPDPEIDFNEYHQLIKQYSGKNVFKQQIRTFDLKYGIQLEGAISASLISGKNTVTETGWKSPFMKEEKGKSQPPLVEENLELRSQYDRHNLAEGKKAMSGVIKTLTVNLLAGNMQINEPDSKYGRIYAGVKLYAEGPSVSLNADERKLNIFSLQFMGVGRWETTFGATFDFYFTVSATHKRTNDKLSAKFNEWAKDLLEGNIKRPTGKLSDKALKRRAIQQLQEAVKEGATRRKAYVDKQIKAKTKLLKGLNNLDDLDKRNRKTLLKYLNKALDPEINRTNKAKLKALRKINGIDIVKGKSIINTFPNGEIKNLKQLTDNTKFVKKGTLLKMLKATPKAKAVGLMAKATFLAERKLLRDFTKESKYLADDLAKLADKEAKIAFREAVEEAFLSKNAHKGTTRAVIGMVSRKLGLKVAAKVALKFIPFVNIAMTAWDVLE